MKAIYTSLVLSLLSSAALAEGLTVGECVSLYYGLNSLDHTTSPDNRVVPNHYKMDFNTRLAVAKNISSLQAIVDVQQKQYNESAEAKAKEVGHPVLPNTLEALQIQNRHQREVLDVPCNVRLQHFSISKLVKPKDGEEQDIPPGTLAAIMFLDEVQLP